MRKEELTVLHNELIAQHIYKMELRGSLAAALQTPGQFVHIRCGSGWETLLRRPISIASWKVDKKTMTIIYRVEGKGTQWLAQRAAGDLVDVLGPLGNGFPLPDKSRRKILLVGGGVGVPPLLGLAEAIQHQEMGAELHIILGFASYDDAFFIEEFSQLGTVQVTTVDGSYGHRGLVSDLLQQPHTWDVFYACGPTPMLATLQTLFADTGVEGYISLEQRMGCGVGTCLACAFPTAREAGEYVKVCSDGPVFRYEELVL